MRAAARERTSAPLPQVSDFGLARDLDILSKVETKTTGTVTHMAPEVLAKGVVSKAADCFSFGVLLWEMASGQRAWAGLTHPQVSPTSSRVGLGRVGFTIPYHTLPYPVQAVAGCMRIQ